jgi:hypothetical protein
MLTSRTHLQDYQAFSEENTNLHCNLNTGRLTSEEFSRRWDALNLKYHSKIHYDDRYIFEDIGEFVGFLIDNSLPKELISHETMHGMEATKRGYTCRYGIWVLLADEGNLGYIPFITIPGRIPVEDYMKILSAPSNPSKSDRAALRLLEES